MRSIEVTARSVEEAVRKGLSELQITKDEAEIEILKEASKGFLGLVGAKPALIRVTEKLDRNKVTKRFLEQVTEKMNIKTTVIAKEDSECLKLTMVGGDLGLIIGRRGETLDALQYLVNLVGNKDQQERKKIILDAEGYRKRREDTLIKLAHRLADKVKRTGHRVVLEPMNPQERRIIHTTLQSDRNVQTISEGEEPYRKVVISLRKKIN